ncbi:hypothetical protein ACFDR9_003640 [Janthinobacterium sp. CG_23.3]|uniref:hypothetical protein n=1 Tax=Janthinobacterium sp. CG_23.3 TaxID=3349634 RepID=UPI0038D47029
MAGGSAAAMRFQALYGEPLDGRRVGADWRPGAPFYAAAPGPLLARLEGVAGAHGLTIIAVVPHFIAAWNRRQGALAPGAWFGLLHRQLLTIGGLDGAEYYWLGQTLAREALLLNLAPPTLLQVCDAAPRRARPPSRWPLAGAHVTRLHIDFAAPSLRRTLFQLHPVLWTGAALAGADVRRVPLSLAALDVLIEEAEAQVLALPLPLPLSYIGPALVALVQDADYPHRRRQSDGARRPGGGFAEAALPTLACATRAQAGHGVGLAVLDLVLPGASG